MIHTHWELCFPSSASAGLTLSEMYPTLQSARKAQDWEAHWPLEKWTEKGWPLENWYYWRSVYAKTRIKMVLTLTLNWR